MKKTLILIAACLFAFGGNAVAQKNIKLGHINSQELLQIMPGRDTAQATLQKEAAEIENELKSMQAELERITNEFMQKQNEWTELIRNTKRSEIQDKQNRIQGFYENAQKQLQEREAELTKPIVERAKKAIEDVAREGGYTYIFDGATLLYSQDSEDIMPQVKKKLGLK
jgi:outer membrane protein